MYVLVCMLGDAVVALATVGVGPSGPARCVARSRIIHKPTSAALARSQLDLSQINGNSFGRMIAKAAVVRDATMIREQVQSLRQRVCAANAGAGDVP